MINTTNIKLEEKILGSLLLDQTLVLNAINILKEYDFTIPEHIKIFKSIKQLTKEQKTLDIFLIKQLSGVSEECLIGIQNTVATTANFMEEIKQLRNLTLKRKFIIGSTDLINQMEHSLDPADKIVDFATKLHKLTEYSLDENWRTVIDDITEFENQEPEKRYSFGIKFLDDALGGYHDKDVIGVASRSGRGKTELANIITEEAARDNNKVLYLALEAEKGEVGSRLKFRNLCKRYFADNPQLIHPLSFDKWMSKKLTVLDKYNYDVNTELSSFGNNIFVQYRNTEFTVEDLNIQLNKCNDIDVVILDHIHYVDIHETNENKGLKKIIKCIRANNLLYEKPIIVVAHLRKTNKHIDGLVPDEDDIFGSSDLNKIITKSILFAPDYTEIHDYLFRTFFHISKCRRNQSAIRYIANLKFDSRVNLYQDRYKLGKYKPFVKEFIEIEKYPSWAPTYYAYQ
jgi:replicative DNA helicase